MEHYRNSTANTPTESFSRIKAGLIRPHSTVGISLVCDLEDYISTLSSVKRDNIVTVGLSSIIPPNDFNQVFVLEVLEYVSWLDSISNVINSEKIIHTLKDKHRGIIINNEHIVFINNLINLYLMFKRQNNIQTSLLLIGYEINLNLIYFWNFS